MGFSIFASNCPIKATDWNHRCIFHNYFYKFADKFAFENVQYAAFCDVQPFF